MIKLSLSPVTPGEKLRLRDDVLPHAKVREWTFEGLERGEKVLLTHKLDGSTWEVKIDDIDWEEYRRRKNLDYSCRKIL